MIVLLQHREQLSLIPKLNLFALGEDGLIARRIRKVCPSQDTRDSVEIHWFGRGPQVPVFDDFIASLEDEGLAREVLMQLFPEHGDVFADGLFQGALVRDPGGPRGALKVEDSAGGLPWLHRAEAAEHGEGCVDVAVFDERREEQLVHGEERLCWSGTSVG